MFPTSDARRSRFRKVPLEEGPGPVSEVSRTTRMPRFLSLADSLDPTSVLSRLRVVCLGVGAVGRPICLHLARLGVGTLWICDKSAYKPESLLTQPAFPDDVGQMKAEVVGRLVKQLSPSTEVYAHAGPFEELGPTAFADADLVFQASDNIRAEIECGRHCLHLGKPLIHASVHGGTLTGQVRFYANASADGPCPACALTEQEQQALGREVLFSCDGSGDRTEDNPTMSTSHLCALAGDLAINQLLRFVLNLGTDVADKVIEWNGFTLQTHVAALERSSTCRVDHVIWTKGVNDGDVADSTPRELARSAAIQDDRLERTSFRVGEATFVQRAVCRHGHSLSTRSFVFAGKTAGSCLTCGEPLVPEPFFNHDAVTGRILGKQLDYSFRELCAGQPEWVVVRENGTAVLFRSTTEPRERSSGGGPK